MIVATTFSVLLLRLVNVLHVVAPDTTSSCERACFREFCKGFLRYILVKVVERNPTGRFKRTFKLSKPDMDVVTGFMQPWTQYEAKCMGKRGESYMRDGLRMFGDLRYPCYTLSP